MEYVTRLLLQGTIFGIWPLVGRSCLKQAADVGGHRYKLWANLG